MKFDIPTLAFIQSLTFVTQVIVLFIQYRVNKTYRGAKWWVLGSALIALGVIFMPLLTVKSLAILARFANPLVVLGEIFLYVGIIRFLDQKENKRLLILIYAVFIFSYYYFMYFSNSISARTVVITATEAIITIKAAYQLFSKKPQIISGSANFTAAVFLTYGCFLAMRAFLTLLMPPIQSYNDQSLIFIAAFIVPNIASTLWTFGFIIMHNQRLDAENLAEKEKVQQLVQQLKVERNTAQLNSLTDSLTGLANRRYFDEALKIEFNRSKRSGFILSLIMLDIDFFKEFNDSYGHLAGDDCLRKIGNVLKTNVRRASDIVARYGGEEFVVLLPETEENGARSLAEGIQKAIEELDIPNADSQISDFVTVSFGIVTLNTTGLTLPEQVVALADEALYNAKKGGRNRIEVAS